MLSEILKVKQPKSQNGMQSSRQAAKRANISQHQCIIITHASNIFISLSARIIWLRNKWCYRNHYIIVGEKWFLWEMMSQERACFIYHSIAAQHYFITPTTFDIIDKSLYLINIYFFNNDFLCLLSKISFKAIFYARKKMTKKYCFNNVFTQWYQVYTHILMYSRDENVY